MAKYDKNKKNFFRDIQNKGNILKYTIFYSKSVY